MKRNSDDDASRMSAHSNADINSSEHQKNKKMDNKILEGTLIYRKGGRLKKNVRMYTVFDMSGAAGASLEVGGMGSLKCYRFTGDLTKKDAEALYSSTKFSSSWDEQPSQNNQRRELCFNIPGHLPWSVLDVENDPTAFVVQISTTGLDTYSSSLGEQNNDDAGDVNDNSNIGNVNIAMKKKDLDDDKSEYDEDDSELGESVNGVFDFWGGNEEESEAGRDKIAEHDIDEENNPDPSRVRDQVKLDLSRALANDKSFVRYSFKCPSSKNNEKALWLAAFKRVGRLSEESKKRRNLFGGAAPSVPLTTSTSQKNSRIRSNSSINAKMFTSGYSGDADNNDGDEGPQKEYRVRPSYAYNHQWMTHSELKEEMEAPSKLMHDTRLSPTVEASPEIGLLRVEVLQCLGLPRQKGKDVNAVVYLVCGSYAFCTDIIEKCQSPMWLRGVRRACTLPIYHGYASLMAGVFHDDGSKGSSSKDTFLGRVEVPIAQLRPNTTCYDVTLPLRQSNSVYTRKRLGAVRLRISVEYYNDREIITSYLPQKRNRFMTTVACADPKSFRNVAMTVHGAHLVEKFSTDMLKAGLREMSFVMAVILQVARKFVRDVVSWRHPMYSAYCFVGWMHCVYANSIAIAPIYIVGFLLLQLLSSYDHYVARGAHYMRPPSWKELLAALIRGSVEDASKKKTNGLSASCVSSFSGTANGSSEFPFAVYGGYPRFGVEECLNDSKQNSVDKMDDFSDDEEEEADGIEQSNLIGPGALSRLPEQNLGVKTIGNNKTITQELKEMELKVHKATKYVFDYPTYQPSDGQEPPFGKKTSNDKSNKSKHNQELDKVLGVGKFSQRNPLLTKITSQFIPVARILSVFLSSYRSIYSIFTWRDPILTFYFTIGLLLSILVLIIFPWRSFLFLAGLILLGPQNWLVRVFREKFQSSHRRRPGRILRAVRELLTDNDGKSAYSEVSQKGLNDGKRNPPPQPLFYCHAPASDPFLERTNRVGAQHITVPYSPIFFNRFQDWPPPDREHARVCSGTLKFDQSFCFSPNPVSQKHLSVILPEADDNKEIGTAPLIKLKEPPEKPEIEEDAIAPPSEKAQDADGSKRLVDCSQPIETKKKNRFSTRMVAKFQPALMKYKQAGKLISVESSGSTNLSGDEIPSIIETVRESDCDEISETTMLKMEDKNRDGTAISKSMCTESKQDVICEEERSQSSEPNDSYKSEDQNAGEIDIQDSGKEIPCDDDIDNQTKSIASPSLCGSDEEVDKDLDLQRCPSSDSYALQLQHLLAIKVELATARTENDNYRMLLKEMEAERDMYKEKYTLIQRRVQGFSLFNRKDNGSK